MLLQIYQKWFIFYMWICNAYLMLNSTYGFFVFYLKILFTFQNLFKFIVKCSLIFIFQILLWFHCNILFSKSFDVYIFFEVLKYTQYLYISFMWTYFKEYLGRTPDICIYIVLQTLYRGISELCTLFIFRFIFLCHFWIGFMNIFFVYIENLENIFFLDGAC